MLLGATFTIMWANPPCHSRQIVQQLSTTHLSIGEKLVEYYPQLLPHLSIYLLKGAKAAQAKAGFATTKSGFTVSPTAATARPGSGLFSPISCVSCVNPGAA